MSARVQQDCMQCVTGIRSERGEECKRARMVYNLQCANNGIRSEERSARVREDCL